MKHALERIVQYALKVIPITERPLRKFITYAFLPEPPHGAEEEEEEASGSCKAFQQMKM